MRLTTILKKIHGTIRGRSVWNGDTTDESSVLSMTFRRGLPPYTLETELWRLADNDPCSASEIL